ncbi:MAG: ATP-binding cassette domain-containing protein [Lachnospiraceae bacterium]|nr:ATP-binding cassette domain-containing protein [Lachnospiraceae bacterium]
MAFLSLANIGKIYVSEGNVAVGIRGVNLSFELGEFVAITGASGSGKSTLLNVLSGMDTYEEGELFIEGQPTSHYLQPDWEEYRAKYISFIFQDYNIIDSFTVLQNVELALMTISDPIERRRRAIELIERVGLKSHMKHKGSQLSGGQKQRTVIARALAKDSPIILADEPTGNLDSETSKEIVELLREVSKDKLLVMVTHNFDQVEHVATRHIRVFDGAVESDQTMIAPAVPAESTSDAAEVPETGKKDENARVSTLSNGFLLGRSIFLSKPKLSLFLCLLLFLGSMAIFLVTAFFGDFQMLFKKNYMFRKEKGRLVIIHQDGSGFTNADVEALREKYGAEKAVRVDYLFDIKDGIQRFAPVDLFEVTLDPVSLSFDYDVDYGKPDLGRYPQSANEVLLYVPKYTKPTWDRGLDTPLTLAKGEFRIVGVKYYLDNTRGAVGVLTEDGFKAATTCQAIPFSVDLSLDGADLSDSFYGFMNPDLKENEIVLYTSRVGSDIPTDKLKLHVTVKKTRDDERFGDSFRWNRHNRYGGYGMEVNPEVTVLDILIDNPITVQAVAENTSRDGEIVFGSGIAKQIYDAYADGVYAQTSLRFSSEGAAKKAAEELNKNGYIAVTTDTEYKPDFFETLDLLLTGGFLAVVWGLAILFIAFFVRLCSNRTVLAFKEDMAIMRSMGIPVRVIRCGIYVRMLLALLPSIILLPIIAFCLFNSPRYDGILRYLQPWQYVFIFGAMLWITWRVTRKQIRVLFGESVKKSLRGGDAV